MIDFMSVYRWVNQNGFTMNKILNSFIEIHGNKNYTIYVERASEGYKCCALGGNHPFVPMYDRYVETIDEVIQYLEDYKSLLTKGELEVF